MTKIVRILNSSFDVLDEILQSGKNVGNIRGIVFDSQVVKNKEKNSEIKFFKEQKGKPKQKMSNKMSQHQ